MQSVKEQLFPEVMEPETIPIWKVRLENERHVVQARGRAREIAEMLGFDRQEQVRLATATSELARNAFRYARGGVVAFEISDGKAQGPQSLQIQVADTGPGIANLPEILDGRYQSRTGMGKGLTGTRRLMDHFEITSAPTGTTVRMGKRLPAGTLVDAGTAKGIAAKLAKAGTDPFQEAERQNLELLQTLAELRDKGEQLAQLNRELEDTNRGVVALYAELEQHANDLRRVSELKTSFLSNLSHEFRTPLNSIVALCQILSDQDDGDLSPEQEKQVGYIRRSATDLSELVDDLLDMAKVEAGKVEIRPRLFHAEDLFGALRGMLRSLLSSTAVELEFQVAPGLPPLFSDEPKLSQVLRNLISNALKFTEQGRVSVSAEARGEMTVFRVADTGIGIAPKDQERIFEEFVQLENPIQSRVRGTGLGLPLARRLAELLGGSLSVESRPQQGSVFTVAIPTRYNEIATGTPVPRSKAEGAPTVLLIEENPETRFTHGNALKDEYSLLFARSLGEARQALNTSTPEAIVMDRLLEGAEALPFIRELRGSGYRGPVVVVSVIEDRETPMRAGADAFLVKPVPAGLLRDTVAASLRKVGAKTVLLVDDDEINRYLLREALTPFGLLITEAQSGREAVRLAQEGPATIFLDLAMPGLSGWETLRELKESRDTQGIPIVIHTSKELTGAEEALIASFAVLQFPKYALTEPDSFEKLRSILILTGAL